MLNELEARKGRYALQAICVLADWRTATLIGAAFPDYHVQN